MLNMSTLSTNDQGKSFWELVYGSVNQVLTDDRPAVFYDVVPFQLLSKEYLTLVKNFLSLVVFCCNFWTLQQKLMIISVVPAKIWYLKNVRFLLGHPVYSVKSKLHSDETKY